MTKKQLGMSYRTPNVDRRQLKGLVPDESDRKNIVEFIKTYDLAFPYPHPESLQRSIQEGRAETVRNHSAIRTSKGGGTERVLTLPQPFVIGLKKAYPMMFTDRGQLNWFLKNFPNLSLRV